MVTCGTHGLLVYARTRIHAMCGERPEAQRSLKFRSTASSQIERIGISFEGWPREAYLASLFVRLEIPSEQSQGVLCERLIDKGLLPVQCLRRTAARLAIVVQPWIQNRGI